MSDKTSDSSEGEFGDLFGAADATDAQQQQSSKPTTMTITTDDWFPPTVQATEDDGQAVARAWADATHSIFASCSNSVATPATAAAAAAAAAAAGDGASDGTDFPLPAGGGLTLHYSGSHHSLWGHQVWHAAKVTSRMMAAGSIPAGPVVGSGSGVDDAVTPNLQPSRIAPWSVDVRSKSVIELGAGMGLPTFAAFALGARVAVATDYPDEELLAPLRRTAAGVLAFSASKAQEEAKDETPAVGDTKERNDAESRDAAEEEGESRRHTGPPPKLAVEPLKWGCDAHLRQALTHVGGTGFDLVILSDILFNHVCHRDLLTSIATLLQKDRKAEALCVLSHHRPHKQREDLNFFALCPEYGLEAETLGAILDYPLMFPDDPGPADVRQPVHCFRLRHHFDEAGPPLDTSAASAFDCVIQGTGLTESLLSAGLSRLGLKVLHLDHAASYGGMFASFSVTQLLEQLALSSNLPSASVEGASSSSSSSSGGIAEPTILLPRRTTILAAAGAATPGKQQPWPPERLGLTTRQDRQFSLDLLPMPLMARSKLLRKVAESQVAKHLELFNVDALVTIDGVPAPPSSPTAAPPQQPSVSVRSVPLTRSDVFQARWLSPLEVRRLMKFMKDVEARIAELEHAATAPAAASSSASAAASSQQPWASALPTETFQAFLARKYGLQPSTVTAITLSGLLQLQGTGPAAIEASFELLRTFLTSVGQYGGATPFLFPMYGCSELPQAMCRVSAVWNGTFVLRRHVTRFEPAEDGAKAYVWLSNGQRIEAACLAIPLEAAAPSPLSFSAAAVAGSGEEVSRVVAVLRRPLFTKQLLQMHHPKKDTTAGGDDDDNGNDVDERDRYAMSVVGAWQVGLPANGGTGSSSSSVPVLIQQVGHSTYQAPQHLGGNSEAAACVVHFSCDGRALGPQPLLEAVRRHFFAAEDLVTASPAGGGDGSCGHADADAVTAAQPTNGAPAIEADPATPSADEEPHVVVLCSFRLSAHAAALHACGGQVPQTSSATGSHEGKETESKTEGAQDQQQHAEQASGLFRVRTLFFPEGGLDDGLYCAEAERAFKGMARRVRQRATKDPWASVSIDAFKQKEAAHNGGQPMTIPSSSAAQTAADTTHPPAAAAANDDDPVFLEEVVDVNDLDRVGEGDREAELLSLV